jgi:hypothetical protein
MICMTKLCNAEFISSMLNPFTSKAGNGGGGMWVDAIYFVPGHFILRKLFPVP